MSERIPVPLELVKRIQAAFIYMMEHGARCPDDCLMKDLDQVLDSWGLGVLEDALAKLNAGKPQPQ
jgi:hypothetical protein